MKLNMKNGNWFKNMDVFGIQIGFTHNGQTTYKSLLGSFFTILYASFIVYFSI
jgi:hypothetical protein